MFSLPGYAPSSTVIKLECVDVGLFEWLVCQLLGLHSSILPSCYKELCVSQPASLVVCAVLPPLKLHGALNGVCLKVLLSHAPSTYFFFLYIGKKWV